MLRAEWLEDRRSYYGGTDAAALVGMSKYKSPLEVWLDKTGAPRTDESSIMAKMGTALEPLCKELFETIEGKTVQPGLKITSPDFPQYFAANVDGLIPEERAVVEYKTYDFSTKSEWGEDGTDEIPPAYYCQCQWYMMLTGYELCYVFAFNRSSGESATYIVRPHAELQAKLSTTVVDFHEKYVVPRVQPEFSAMECDIEYLKQRYDPQANVVVATREIDQAAHRLLDVNEALRPLSKEKKQLETQIKAAIGLASAIETAVGRFEWPMGAEKQVVNWENIARGFLDALVHDGKIESIEKHPLVTLNTTTTPGTRRFKSPKE